MRVSSVELSWFRGASDKVALELEGKSMVVYGENGSGKSSFVDVVEYVLKDGKIGHLTHEYSGRHQERGTINTHIPAGTEANLKLTFNDGTHVGVRIARSGLHTTSVPSAAAIKTWDYRRTVLRQDEVAAFISGTKGDKYSALLPLLGLDELEIAAQNVKQLSKAVEQVAKLAESKGRLLDAAAKRKANFGTQPDAQIRKTIEALHAVYCPESGEVPALAPCCKQIEEAVAAKLAGLTLAQRMHLAIEGIASVEIAAKAQAVRAANSRLAAASEPLIRERLDVLQAAQGYLSQLGDEKEVACPACGQAVAVPAFRDHVRSEQERLQDAVELARQRKFAVSELCDSVKELKTSIAKEELKKWCEELSAGPIKSGLDCVRQLDLEKLRDAAEDEKLVLIEKLVEPVVQAAVERSKTAPPDIQRLFADKQTVEAGRMALEATELAAAASRADALIRFLGAVEEGVREEIRQRAEETIKSITTDIQTMWAILHPREPVEAVRLYVPADSDKAIDVGLKFHGVPQDSPRLTLSEGFRNSLGLCIFLAMAKREATSDRPLFLDDVVVSLDRNHRGMVLGLLEKEFSQRQVVILTHDREWYTELRQQIDDATWGSKALMPYESPKVGIRWSSKTSTFADARARLVAAPDEAGNIARKIMDIELAMRSERVRVRLPYLHREKNDHRMAHDFMQRLIKDGERCFRTRSGQQYTQHAVGLDALRAADKFLLSWANKASHSFDVVRSEAEKLIDACDQALKAFDCSKCQKPVYKLEDDKAEIMQCSCGELRWDYGKA